MFAHNFHFIFRLYFAEKHGAAHKSTAIHAFLFKEKLLELANLNRAPDRRLSLRR